MNFFGSKSDNFIPILMKLYLTGGIIEAIRMGRMTALRNTNGGVRGIVGRRGEAIGCTNCGPTIGTEC